MEQKRLVIGAFTHTDGSVPSGYVCGGCGRNGCKLWRENVSCSEYMTLLCAECALKEEGCVGPVDSDGYRTVHVADFADGEPLTQKTAQIGSRLPAVPDEDGRFWWYTSIPRKGVNWWRGLPT